MLAAYDQLAESDILGASLGEKQPEDLNKDALKRWLVCCGAAVFGTKPQLVEQVKDYIATGLDSKLVDPDNGVSLQAKRGRLNLVPDGKENLSPMVPKEGWSKTVSGMPALHFLQIQDYLIYNKAVTSDGDG